MMGTIKQRADDGLQRKDCFLCCAAMAAGKSYDDSWGALTDDLREVMHVRGPKDKECAEVLRLLGLGEAIRDYTILFRLPEFGTVGFMRNMLWGRRAMIQVPSKNYDGEMHIVYWDGRELHDPSNLRLYAWIEVEPVYVWLFDETRR